MKKLFPLKWSYVLLVFILFGSNSFSQEHFPGGVAGAEMWYMVHHEDLTIPTPTLKNHSKDYNYIFLKSCKQDWQKTLFNFNESITTDELCFSYIAPLENTTARNIFFVGEPKLPAPNDPAETYSHISTKWNTNLESLSLTSSPIANRFDFSDKNGLINKHVLTYDSNNNAHINFYNWNLYQLQNKLKSYGKEGETEFNIGKSYFNPPNQEENIPAALAEYFAGNFPEFISFPFELTYNQRNRVESYLALKYGITLVQNGTTNYRNSKNIIFWNQNNTAFWNRIFGIGRDDISGLNQLQSESSHFKDYLIASVGELQNSNPDKQALVWIDNNNFIVFGDNGATDYLMDVNDFNVRPLKRKWLSQNTGENASVIPIFFKVNLEQAIKDAMTQNPTLKLWMLHDKYVNNTEVSDFNSQYVDYYEAASLDGLDYGFFRDVFFDTDEAIYDQFTFGVGPQMIVQVRFEPDCDDNTVRSRIVITGGRGPYRVGVRNTGGSYQEEFSINENTMTFDAIAPDTYIVSVIDTVGNQASTEVEVELEQIDVNLGNDIVLNQNLQEVTLDATQNDPDATYKWYFNGELLEHFNPTLLASEPGTYKTEVISGNQMCQDSDEITLSFDFTAIAVPQSSCGEETGSITLTLSGGVSQYSVHIHNEESTSVPVDIFTVSDSENIFIDGVNFGDNTVTIQDENGEEVVLNVDVVSPLDGIDIELISQLNEQCTPIAGPDYPSYYCPGAIVDGGLLVTNPNVSYEWFLNGQSTGIYNPTVEIYSDYENNPYPTGVDIIEYELVITNLNNSCTISEKFGLQKATYIRSTSTTSQRMAENSEPEEVYEEATPLKTLVTKVYPNPVEHSTTFYYEISSNKIFTGTVEVFDVIGAILYQENINGKSSYKLPLRLLSSGNYLIRATTSEGTVTNQVIIK